MSTRLFPRRRSVHKFEWESDIRGKKKEQSIRSNNRVTASTTHTQTHCNKNVAAFHSQSQDTATDRSAIVNTHVYILHSATCDWWGRYPNTVCVPVELPEVVPVPTYVTVMRCSWQQTAQSSTGKLSIVCHCSSARHGLAVARLVSFLYWSICLLILKNRRTIIILQENKSRMLGITQCQKNLLLHTITYTERKKLIFSDKG